MLQYVVSRRCDVEFVRWSDENVIQYAKGVIYFMKNRKFILLFLIILPIFSFGGLHEHVFDGTANLLGESQRTYFDKLKESDACN